METGTDMSSFLDLQDFYNYSAWQIDFSPMEEHASNNIWVAQILLEELGKMSHSWMARESIDKLSGRTDEYNQDIWYEVSENQ